MALCLSVTSWCSIKMAKHRIMALPHSSPGTVVSSAKDLCKNRWTTPMDADGVG